MAHRKGVLTSTVRLSRREYSVDAATLAVRLLGCRLVRLLDDRTRLSGIIVETEAYIGVEDQASHAFGGRRTPRNESMFAGPGTAYVYFTYGMHHCMNIVCGDIDEPVAVLIRALEPIEGLEQMKRHRTTGKTLKTPITDLQLCNGPGKLCKALAIDRLLDGADLVLGKSLFIETRGKRPHHAIDAVEVVNTTRIGIASAGTWTHKPLRWYIKGNKHVSVR